MIVVDASAVLEVLLRTPAAGAVEARLFAPGETLAAPHLIDVEVAQLLRRYTAAGEIDSARGARRPQRPAAPPLSARPPAAPCLGVARQPHRL